MFALRPLTGAAKQAKQLLRQEPMQAQQKRCMSGGGDDGVHRVNWWDAPSNPDVWHKHHLAWITAGIYGTVAWAVTGGGKKEAAAK
mmetsp:Transcript_7259/g.12488  ORF Transcript_7259/g.12488 Transcript_7259/m.12488 type:complete len:86 (+) Transcript_7259:99-356(+)|eukprot:CAMPEP_0119102324 /NCGR_PEP_ID=MMETSP1180-20130426/1103_1 /TAXON_ID=3052 ORGANISM="Chlamydomonas cf sp, Strain CCMP681" /NCGR_SAMPLE_ID=MMETSP1180 /ASSEMBLY_ACC=CAM_ASM_000741 /LENGTH=85 /DNA_ID=CAMNT_0007086581 /DNA_START=63 /DNA_END=320 /DNA_ORIENTATION=-